MQYFSFAMPSSPFETFAALTFGRWFEAFYSVSLYGYVPFSPVSGASPEVCLFLWDSIYRTKATGARKKHLLSALYFLKISTVVNMLSEAVKLSGGYLLRKT